MNDDSKKFVTINTHKGLYVYNCLPYEVAAEPSIFQHSMEGILRGMSDIYVYLDDILIGGDSEEKHLQLLDEALSRLEVRNQAKTCKMLIHEDCSGVFGPI